MTVVELLAGLRRRDVHVVLEGEKLRLSAPAGVLSEANRLELQQRKEEIVAFLREAERLAAQSHAIVPLTPGGTRPPVFAVPGHNGDVFCYRALAERLGSDQPFFGLEPPGVEEGSRPLDRVEDIAAYFARQIVETRSAGPYTIAGFCAGGTIAFELACQLKAQGEPVAGVVLFGAPFCGAYRMSLFATAVSRARRVVYLGRRVAVHAKALLSLPAAERRGYVADRIRTLRGPAPGGMDPIQARRVVVENATTAALQEYQPRMFEGHVDVMLPCTSWKTSEEAPLRWSDFAASSAEFAGPDDCTGDSMLRPQYAEVFADLLERAQRQRPAAASAVGRSGASVDGGPGDACVDLPRARWM